MTQELCYTSAPRGLWPGSHGYCTVACTARMPRAMVERLESLSGYRPLYPPHDPRASLNPVSLSALRVVIGGRPYTILSRIGFSGLDYTDRANKYAHHVVLDDQDLPLAGPAWLLGQPGFMRKSWDGRVEELTENRPVPQGDTRPAICHAWKRATGDAGWAGVLAESFLADPKKAVYLVYEPGLDLLPLFAEALALLPSAQRWDPTFSTYLSNLPQGVVCSWRGVVRDSPEAVAAQQMPQALVLNLTRDLGTARGDDLVELARTGRRTNLGGTPPPIPGPTRIHGTGSIRRESPSPTPRIPAETYEPASVPHRNPSRPPRPPRIGLRETPQRQNRSVFIITAAALATVLIAITVVFLAPSFRETKKPAVKQRAIHLELARDAVPSNDTEIQPPAPKKGGPQPSVPEETPKPSPELKPETIEKENNPQPRLDYASLPPPNPLTNDSHVLCSKVPFKHYELTIHGLNGNTEINKLNLQATHKHNNTKHRNRHSITFTSPQKTILASIQSEDQKITFTWGSKTISSDDHENNNRLNIIESCVLHVEPLDDDADNSTIRIVLRNLAKKQEPLTLNRFKTGQPIEFHNDELPFGRPLNIHHYELDSSRIHPKLDIQDKPAPYQRTFTIKNHPNISLHLLLIPSQPESSTAKTKHQLKFSFTPDEREETSNARNHISNVTTKLNALQHPAKDNASHIAPESDKAKIVEITLDSLNQLSESLNQIEHKTQNNPQTTHSIKIETPKKQAPTLIPIKTIPEQYPFDKMTAIPINESLTTINNSVNILNNIQAFKSDISIDSIKLSISLAMTIEGESIEIIRIGDFKKEDEAKGTPAGGPEQ